MTAPRVLNKRKVGFVLEAVDIMRPGKWGNPFVIGRHGTREEVIEKYRVWLTERPQLVRLAQLTLGGRDLLCCCAPLPCHGDVLIEVANKSIDGPVSNG